MVEWAPNTCAPATSAESDGPSWRLPHRRGPSLSRRGSSPSGIQTLASGLSPRNRASVPQKTLDRIIRHVEAWGDPFPPACACGCGEPTRFNEKGPTRVLNRQHAAYFRDYASISAAGHRAKRARKDTIPIEDFRSAIRKLQERKGWSLSEIARRGGQYRTWLNAYMTDPRYQTIGRETATLFLRRASGLGAPPSRHQERIANIVVPAIDRAIYGIGMDRPN